MRDTVIVAVGFMAAGFLDGASIICALAVYMIGFSGEWFNLIFAFIGLSFFLPLTAMKNKDWKSLLSWRKNKLLKKIGGVFVGKAIPVGWPLWTFYWFSETRK